MNTFTKNSILENSEIIAKELRRAREAKNLSLEEASKHLKIKLDYISALEQGDFDKLPKGIYKLSFLREYAVLLGLPAEDIINLFSESNESENSKANESLFVRKAKHVNYFVTIPKLLKNLLIFSSALVCFVYIIFGINAIVSAPELIVASPSMDMVIDKKEIVVEGETDPGAEITINDELVLANSEGVFSKKINLKSGINTIVIVAHKKYSRKSEEVKKVMVDEG